MTQTALAEGVGVDQSAIAHFEAGRAHPTEDLLRDLALQLGFDTAFFSKSDPPAFPYGSLLYRARSRLTAASRLRAHRTAELAFEVAEFLVGSSRSHHTVPRTDGRDPTASAELTRSALGVSPRGPALRIVDALERAGVWVLPLPVEIEGHDAFSAWVGELPVIAITGTSIPPDRLNFSLAHELGHLVMHRSPSGSRMALEGEANRFAGEFLVPHDDAIAELMPPMTPAKLTALKVKWQVSMQALLLRAKQTRRVTEKEYVSAMKQISARGWRKVEPYSGYLPRQWPRRWRLAAKSRYGDAPSARRLTADTSVPPSIGRWMLAEDVGRRAAGVTGRTVVPFPPSSGRA